MSQPPPTGGEGPGTDPTSAEIVALAEDLGAIRRRVLNVIGHELRTPTTTIQGLAQEVCEAQDLAVVTGELGPALLRNATRLMSLLDQMLVAAGIQTALPVGSPEDIDVAELLVSRWASRSAEELDLRGDRATVHLPRAAVVAAVDAVLDNALHHGVGAPVVQLTAMEDGVTVAVASAGTPPHPEEVRLATEPFFRGERAVTTRPGLGLGLAIARAVLDQVGGDLRFTAQPDGVVTAMVLPAAIR